MFDYVSSNAKSSLFGAMLYIFEDNEAVIKMTKKAEVPLRDMYQEPTELHWIGCLTELIWTPRFRFGALTPNINSQTF